jgi:hypothetical protein
MHKSTLAAAILALGCGGNTSEGDGSGGALNSGGTSGSSGGSAGSGGTTGGSGGTTGGSGGTTGGNGGTTGGSGGVAGTAGTGGRPSCDELLEQMNEALASAKQCCAACDNIQCTGMVEGLCCSETVQNVDSEDTQRYLAALTSFRLRDDCSVGCPEIPCPIAPSTACLPSASGAGRCQ